MTWAVGDMFLSTDVRLVTAVVIDYGHDDMYSNT